MPKRITTAATTLVFGAAAGAILAFAPIASADDPPPCAPDDQQCQAQQQQQPDPAGIVGSVADQLNQGSNGQSQGPAISPYPTTGPVGGVCAFKNGFPVYIPPGGMQSEVTDVITGPVTVKQPCTNQGGPAPLDAVQRGTDAADQIAGAATPPSQQADPSQQQPPPPQ